MNAADDGRNALLAINLSNLIGSVGRSCAGSNSHNVGFSVPESLDIFIEDLYLVVMRSYSRQVGQVQRRPGGCPIIAEAFGRIVRIDKQQTRINDAWE